MADIEMRADAPTAIPTPLIALAVVGMALVVGSLLFVPAGRLDWMLGWVYMLVLLVYVGGAWACLARWNPELVEARMHFGPGTKTWDKVWAVLYAPVMVAVYVVAGLEVRSGAPAPLDLVWLGGLALFVPGAALLTWSMVVNPFFEKTVRIQTERGHRVIDTGPYAYVRHPGYVGFVGWMLATPLLLGSSWALVPTALAVIGIVVRTALEDRTLMAELAGYPEYAARVRYRLFPGVW
jgi:protein-S-isoprenylcysteine O-methyltransferase Ste14